MLKPYLVLSVAMLSGIALAPAPTRALGAAPQDAAAPASTNPVKPTAASQDRAKALYARDCAFCHGDNGDGKTDMAKSMSLNLDDWTDPKTLVSKSDQQLFDKIRKGSEKPMMPPEDEARAKKDEIWNLIIYIRNMSKGQPARTPAADAPPADTPAPPPAPPADAPKPNR
jgi:mono/diheme cytochrome c family protein